MNNTHNTTRIAIASGKGGTGKTTVSVNLFHFIQKYWTNSVELVDCDVEEPNDRLFLDTLNPVGEEQATRLIPQIDMGKCTYCRKCVAYCEFNAIVVIPTAGYADINQDLCHSCGACSLACKFGAITESHEKLGDIKSFENSSGSSLKSGELVIGSAMQTMMIKELKKKSSGQFDIYLLDSPPGTSCPVVATVNDADYVLLVAEPTVFGLYDLQLMVELLRDIQKPFGVIINKAGLGNGELGEYLCHEDIEVLGEIPFSRDYAARYSSGNLLVDIPEEIETGYASLIQKLQHKLN